MAVDTVNQKPKGSRIPLLFFAFFGVVFLANGIMIYVAMSSWTGLETKNHYLKGLNYNAALEGAAEQASRGWTTNVELLDRAGLTARLVVVLEKPDGNPVVGADFDVELLRPTHMGYDQAVTLSEVEPGRYESMVRFPLAGQWDIRQSVHHKDGTYQAVERVMVKP